MNIDNIKKEIISLYNEGKSCEEIAYIVMIDKCPVDVFGINFPSECDKYSEYDEYYCEECCISSIEDFLEEYLNKEEE